jgi:S-adenosylmethionine synthetase
MSGKGDRIVEVHVADDLSVERFPFEIVELKGTGHPDSLADGISEAVANFFRSTCRAKSPPYIYSDKVLITPGVTVPKFGAGKIIKPFHIYIPYISNCKIKPAELKEAVYQYIENTLSRFRRDNADITVMHRKPTKHSCQTHKDFPAEFEDTGIAVGYAPLTKTERFVKDIGTTLNSKHFRNKHSFVGEDIKLLAERVGHKVNLTVACAFICDAICDLDHYLDQKGIIRREVLRIGQEYGFELNVEINPDDRPEIGSVYITVLGSSIEHGDCGVTGRGNRWNGLISPLRPMVAEAVPGKNLQNHPAKILTTIAEKISTEIHEKLLVEDVTVILVGRVGSMLRDVDHIYIRVAGKRRTQKDQIKTVASYWFNRYVEATTEEEFYSIASI